MQPSIVRLVLLIVGLGCVAGPLRAEEFRIETDVFLGDEKKPFAQNLTIFTSGLIYDFPLAGPEEITVLDPVRGRFILLDVKRKVKSVVDADRILEYVAAIKVHAAEVQGAYAAAANPSFDESFDSISGKLILASESLTYRVTGMQPKTEAAAFAYREFADWYARLNAFRPGGMPPFARMELNRKIADRGWVPEEVELTVVPENRVLNRNLVIRSRHLFNWRLSNTDQNRVSKAGDHLAKFQTIGLDEFWQRADVAARK